MVNKKNKPCKHDRVSPMLRADKLLTGVSEILVVSVNIICYECKAVVREFDKQGIGLLAVNEYIAERELDEGVKKFAELEDTQTEEGKSNK